MNRLQKKCLVATAGTHLLLVVALLCSGFIKSKPQAEDVPLITIIPDVAVNTSTSSPPKITPTPTPTPPEPKPPEPTPPPVHDDPPPTPVKHVDPVEPLPPEKSYDSDVKVLVKPPVKPKQPHVINPVMDKTVVKNNKPNIAKPTVEDTSEADAKAEQERLRRQRAAQFARLTHTLENNLSPTTQVEIPEEGSVSFASYASIVKSIYETKWQAPDDAANDQAITKVSVTIARDGHVINARVIDGSGDSRVDASVRRTLSNVKFIKAFPAGATESEKTFIINFNLQSKKLFG